MPVEARVVSGMYLAAVVTAAAVHAQEVFAALSPALPEALCELLLPVSGFTEAHGEVIATKAAAPGAMSTFLEAGRAVCEE